MRVMLVRHVILIAGPPCSGKTTLAHELATDHEIVDYDDITGQHGIFDPDACDELDRRINRIANDPDARAIVIRTVPRGEDRQALTEKLDAECILLMPDKAECVRRAAQRPSGTRKAIGMWFWKYTPAECDVAKDKYGSEHQRERKRWVSVVARGDQLCAEMVCLMDTRTIDPREPWHLAHDPTGTVIIGVSHERCNTSEGASRGNRMRGQARVTRWNYGG